MASNSVDSPKRNTKARAWVFTFNNYDVLDIDLTKQLLIDSQTQFVFGEEIGKEGTPHLQGYFRFENQRTFSSVKNMLPKCHIEPCKNWIASKNYCSKDGKIYTNIKDESADNEYDEYMHSVYDKVVWYPWQQEIIDILEDKPDERTVHWYYEADGNIGKSFLIKYLDWKHNAVIANGKQTDVFNGVREYIDTEKKRPKVVLIDIPRYNKDYISYGWMEKLKDGLFYSGKYEGGKIRLLPLHLIVMANFKPDKKQFSEDRWHIVNIADEDYDSD